MLTGCLDFGHDVLTFNMKGLVGGSAQGDMKDGSVFGEVDFIATEHSVPEFLDFAIVEELPEKL